MNRHDGTPNEHILKEQGLRSHSHHNFTLSKTKGTKRIERHEKHKRSMTPTAYTTRTPMRRNMYPTNTKGYKLEFTFQKGNYGLYWSAIIIDPESMKQGENVAIKMVNLEKIGSSSHIMDILQNEMDVVSTLAHGNVLTFHTSFTADKELWIIMPMAKSGNLNSIIQVKSKVGIQDEALVASILLQIINGLQYLHSFGFLHGDIKSENILVHQDGKMQLSNFGQTEKLYYEEKMMKFVGSPCWMAPEKIEQVNGYDLKSDVWSLGITAIEICQGKVPYQDYKPMQAAIKIYNGAPPQLSTYIEWSFELKSFIADCLNKDPIKRPSMSQLLQRHSRFFRKANGKAYIKENLLNEMLPFGVENVNEDILKIGQLYKEK